MNTHPHPETLAWLAGPTVDALRTTAALLDSERLAVAVLADVDRTWSTVAVDELYARILVAEARR